MILADTSIWVDHLRTNNRALAVWLENGQVLTHPFIIGELNNSPLRSWGAALAYSWVESPNGSQQTWWMLHFYGNPLFLCWQRKQIPPLRCANRRNDKGLTAHYQKLEPLWA